MMPKIRLIPHMSEQEYDRQKFLDRGDSGYDSVLDDRSREPWFLLLEKGRLLAITAMAIP